MKDKLKNSIHIQEFSAALIPQYQEVIKNKPYVFYGDDNLFPNHLLALYNYSPITRACANATIYGVKGKNLLVKEGDPNSITMANRSETVYEVFEKCVTDRILFGGFALNIVKGQEIATTDSGKRIMLFDDGTYKEISSKQKTNTITTSKSSFEKKVESVQFGNN